MTSADSFEAVVDQHYAALFRFAMSLTQRESDAEDLTQQTFYVWASKGHQLRDRSKVKSWLFTTLHRVFLQAQRRQRRFNTCELGEVAEQLPSVLPRVVDQTDCAQVLSALAELEEPTRAALALFYLDQWSYAEIAAILGVPLGTVKSRLSRGIAELREILLQEERLSEINSRPLGLKSHPQPGTSWMQVNLTTVCGQ